jgi:uncharacterized membrane protein
MQTIQVETKPDNRAINYGVICLLLGCVLVGLIPLVGWLFGGPLFLIAIILSIIAMCKNNVGRGIVLLFCTFLFPIIAQVIGLAFVFYTHEPITAAKPQPPTAIVTSRR